MDKDSGFAHHLQHRLQPLKNMVVRIPFPSCKQNFWILKISAFKTISPYFFDYAVTEYR